MSAKLCSLSFLLVLTLQTSLVVGKHLVDKRKHHENKVENFLINMQIFTKSEILLALFLFFF